MPNRKYDIILENLNVGYFFIDSKGIILDVNDAWVKLYKYDSKEEVIGNHLAVIQKIDDIKLAEEVVTEIMSGNPEYMSGEFSRKCKDDTIGYHSFSASPVNKNGDIVGIEGVIIDCTERKILQEELRKSKETLEQYLHNAAEIVLTLDSKGNITLLNDSGHHLLGYENGGLIGKNWFDMCISADIRENIKAVFSKMMLGEVDNVKNFENQVINKKGELISVLWHNSLLKDENNKIIGTISSGENITELKRIETGLKKAEEDWKNIFNSISDLTIILSPEQVVIDLNEAALFALGMKKEDILGKKCHEVFHQGINPPAKCPFEALIKSQKATIEQMEIEILNGTYLVTVSPVFDEDNNLEKVIHYAKDVTQIEELQSEITDREERLNLAIESTGLGVWDQDYSTGKVIRNDKWATMLGYLPEEIEKTADFYIKSIHPDDLFVAIKVIKDHRYGKTEILSVEHRLKTKNGDWKWISNTGKIIKRDEFGKPLRALGIHEDITDRKAYEEQLRLGKHRLEILNKIIRHDLANDFNVIKSAVSLYRRKADTRFIDEIDKRADISLKTIRSYKKYEDFLESNIELEVIDLKKIFQEITPIFKDVKIIFNGSGRVMADRALSSVFRNLITNSIIHGNATEIIVDIKPDIEFCEIRIEDNGSGIPSEIQDKIFEEGYSHGSSGNTGIGLFIVRQTILGYGGDVYIPNEKTKGATFVIKLKKAHYKDI